MLSQISVFFCPSSILTHSFSEGIQMYTGNETPSGTGVGKHLWGRVWVQRASSQPRGLGIQGQIGARACSG
ncbi:hypothetical protein GE21DRAFT_1106725 [Neurospora crassa]|nr:hypothetical protein GE21DRAFT_1106725 [Neurospora crassa]